MPTPADTLGVPLSALAVSAHEVPARARNAVRGEPR